MKLSIFNLSAPALITTICLCFIPSGNNSVAASGHWEYDAQYSTAFYVYETRESAVYLGESSEKSGVFYFRTGDGNVWGAYVSDPDIQEGESVILTFKNRVPKSEYDAAVEYGTTRIDSGQIVSID